MNIGLASVLVSSGLLVLASCGLDSRQSNVVAGRQAGEGSAMTAEAAAAKGFSRILVEGSFDVYYVQGNQTSVKLKGDKEGISQTVIDCDGQTLTLSTEQRNVLNMADNDGVDVYITSPKLSGIEICGSGDFHSDSSLSSNAMVIDVTGSGDVSLRSLQTDKCEISIAGSGDVSVGGLTAKTLVSDIAGSGDISLRKANIGSAVFSIAGSGDINVDGNVGKYDKDIAGSGELRINR